jgi:transcriptional regulator GlxA family with amidase domain
VFFIAEAMRPVQAQAGFTILPNYSFHDQPALDAFLIPGGAGTRQETFNRSLHQYIRDLPSSTILAGLCTGPWVYAQMGLLDGLAATARKEGDPQELSVRGMIPIDRLAALAPEAKISRARIVDAGRIITAAGISSGMELGFYLLRRAGFEESFLREVARVMEYLDAYDLRKDSLEIAAAIK